MLLALFAWALPAPAHAQQAATVRRDGEAFRSDPGGTQLARLAAGLALTTQDSRGGNTQVTVDGWVILAALRKVNRDGHNLAVSRSVNLRATPSTNGRILGRLVAGALLDQVEQRDTWVHVQRDGWVASAALAAGPAPAAAADTGADARRAVLKRAVQSVPRARRACHRHARRPESRSASRRGRAGGCGSRRPAGCERARCSRPAART